MLWPLVLPAALILVSTSFSPPKVLSTTLLPVAFS